MKKIDLPIEKTDEESPLNPNFKWFFKMLKIIFCLWLFLFFSIQISTKIILKNLSIEKEKEIFWNFYVKDNKKIDKNLFWENIWELKNYEIYLLEKEKANAFASLWANIFLTTWLLNEIKTKEELFFILWHELQHIKNRDTINWITTNLWFSLFFYLLWLDFDNNFKDFFTNYYSREAERKADLWWINFINNLWLNGKCAVWFFERNKTNNIKFLEFSKNHPIDQERIDFIKKYSKNKDKKCQKFEFKKIRVLKN